MNYAEPEPTLEERLKMAYAKMRELDAETERLKAQGERIYEIVRDLMDGQRAIAHALLS